MSGISNSGGIERDGLLSGSLRAASPSSANTDASILFNRELSGALGKLSELDNTEKLREDAIANGKAIIKNWTPPTDSQIDTILFRMKKELLA